MQSDILRRMSEEMSAHAAAMPVATDFAVGESLLAIDLSSGEGTQRVLVVAPRFDLIVEHEGEHLFVRHEHEDEGWAEPLHKTDKSGVWWLCAAGDYEWFLSRAESVEKMTLEERQALEKAMAVGVNIE